MTFYMKNISQAKKVRKAKKKKKSKKQTWVGYISQKIYIPEYIRFEDIFTGYNITVKNRIYDRDILGLVTKNILYPYL